MTKKKKIHEWISEVCRVAGMRPKAENEWIWIFPPNIINNK